MNGSGCERATTVVLSDPYGLWDFLSHVPHGRWPGALASVLLQLVKVVNSGGRRIPAPLHAGGDNQGCEQRQHSDTR
ncbi:hypothetical protein GCM10010523_24990 [Paenarthrobacter ilicis]